MKQSPQEAIAAIAKQVQEFYTNGENEPEKTVEAITTIAHGQLGATTALKNWMRTFGISMEELKRHAIMAALASFNGSTSKAAIALGISVRQVQYRLKEWRTSGLVADQPRGEQARHAS